MPATLTAALAALAAAGPPIETQSQTQEGRPMTEILREADQEVVQGPEAYFTGKATIRANFSREDPSRVTGAIVSFEPGARTAWHSHPLGQTLIVTAGTGWTRVEGGEKLEFRAGDVMLCPRGVNHWHGATPDSAMTHVAIQEAEDGTNVVWGEKVTDEEYLEGTAMTD